MVKSINVLGAVYTIKKCELYDVNSSTEYIGMCDYINKEIRIWNGAKSEKDILSIRYHELIHAVLYESGLKYIMDGETEHICEIFAKIISDQKMLGGIYKEFMQDLVERFWFAFKLEEGYKDYAIEVFSKIANMEVV